ncbi:hypothetical protein VHEMI02946 [[Torrubiella] hemipterigena]|uniref:Secreted protein n=1 Tax=[Torrubiella] hemipterigena TaxID=1531966 RepID=A0A0A1T9M9_9HYPO|nr:hypothetical protein VHEMI02946 [[Torrubiella] hemipterigena]
MAPILQSLLMASMAVLVFANVMKYPEVVPGPSLPSLEEVGLTSAQLYQMGRPKSLSSASTPPSAAAAHTGCGPTDSAYANVNDVIACYHYLNNLGDQACHVPGDFHTVIFCVAGGAAIGGQGLRGDTDHSCREVAAAALWAVDHCTRSDQSVAGFQSVAGDDDVVVVDANRVYLGAS